ncbi:unnamed protein product [Darwinula stevensoni]|uniref:Uncharacterized protein n=1 Tax=Darwinula stevensoni TaxID=69355 RepID=A0A7R9A1B3_9CRUS|nr:unnamed protein product [Darwinula stevensoni]CAG0886294.1 unnamed protein product [Darwinula stevensoni]
MGLYELNDDAKRKEFLDDLFSFMQKRGTPINRLPIMAKQVLDLYELFNLVIARGGLVEVINKKLWQEVIKGLNLPSSITSAAFTLRTQYMKYLYPFECYKERLSTPEELQAAIDGNRREGRRSSYTAFGEMTSHARSGSLSHQQMSPLSLVRPSMNGSSSSHPLAPGGLPPTTTSALLDMQARLNLWNKLVDQVGGGRGDIPPTFFPPPQHEALNLAATGGGGAVKREDGQNQNSPSPPSKKRHLDEKSHGDNLSPITGTHIKITSRGDGRGGVDNSLVVSMEINGVIYQGVLFAQGSSRDRIL